MRRSWGSFLIAAVCISLCTETLYAASPAVEDLKAEVERLRKDIAAREDIKLSPITDTDQHLSGRYGPNAEVVTRGDGVKLEISGLLQVWYQHVDNDTVGVTTAGFGFPPNNATPIILPEGNEGNDNDTFRIRRSELRFSIDVHKHVSAFVMIDPAREANDSFYPIPTLPRHNIPSGGIANGVDRITPVQSGIVPSEVLRPRLLQDAFITFKDVVPHHTFLIGQFKPPAGEEAWRNSGALDFVERAMVTGINNVRDIGAMVNGNWLDGRVQYYFGVFNGPSGTVLTDPELTEAGNRSDDNDAKDFGWRLSVRPVWSNEKWYGRLELGYHRTDGEHGEAGQEFDPDFSLNALNIERTSIFRQGAWAWYRPSGPVRGWWLRGEWGQGHDRYGSGALTGLLGTGSVDLGATGARGGQGFTQQRPTPVTASGWFFSTGYYMPESIFAAGLKDGNWAEKALYNMEFAFRYEVYENVAMEDLVQPDRHTDQFKTQAWTMGLNYYLQGRGTKIQANYIIVDDPASANPLRGLREVQNNIFVVNFQLSF